MSKYFIVFGQKSPFRNGWVELEAKDMDQARERADYALGKDGYARVIFADDFTDETRSHFPDGKIGATIK